MYPVKPKNGRLFYRGMWLALFGFGLTWIASGVANIVITKLQYKKAAPQSVKQLTGLLGYLQYRPEATQGEDLPRGGRRWVDVGLGDTARAIRANCEQRQSAHVLAFTWVIAPHPDCMALIASEEHKRFVGELTERAIAGLFEARAMPVPEYAYLYHTRETEDLSAPGQLNPHTHIILAGTYEDPLEGRQPYYMNKSRKRGEDHPDLFWKVAETEMNHLMDQYVGLDWPERLEQVAAERAQDTQSRQDQVIQERLAEMVRIADSTTFQRDAPAPDCWGESQDGQLWRGWITARPSGSDRHEVGVYWQTNDLLANLADTFEPLLTDLAENQLQVGKRQFLEVLAREPTNGITTLRDYAAELQSISAEHSRSEAAQSVDDDFSIGMEWSL